MKTTANNQKEDPMAKTIKRLYPKTIFVENLGYEEDKFDDLAIGCTAEGALADDEDEVTIAVYKFEKMVTVRREQKITVTDAK
jgi:hypothetical protein